MKNVSTGKIKIASVLAVLVCMLLLAGCLPGQNPNAGRYFSAAGFWAGIWHGIICPFTLIISLFTRNVSFYEVHNCGWWYNFGFLIGAAATLGGGGRASNR